MLPFALGKEEQSRPTSTALALAKQPTQCDLGQSPALLSNLAVQLHLESAMTLVDTISGYHEASCAHYVENNISRKIKGLPSRRTTNFVDSYRHKEQAF